MQGNTEAQTAKIWVACNNATALRVSFPYHPEANRAMRALGADWIYRWVWGIGLDRLGDVVTALENLGFSVVVPAVAA